MGNEPGDMIPWARRGTVRSVGPAVVLLGAMAGIALLWGATPGAQAVDRSQPPRVEASAGGFTVRRLANPVTVDGQMWIAVMPIIGTQTVPASNGSFAIKLEEATSVEVMHFRVWFIQDAGAPVLIAPGTAIYTFITPDSRWIINGTLEAIDVRNWRTYSLSKAFNIEPYVILEAVSADGRRLLISQQPCWVDCRNFPATHYEIGFPAG